MNVGNVLRLTAWAWAAFAAAGLLAVAAAAVGGARAGELFGLGLGVGLSGFASGLAFAISRSDRLRPLRVGDVAMGLILAWATTPFFMAVGAVAAGWRDGVWRGYVAAVSAATTTGPLFDLGFATDAALYWDAYCAWLGGAATLSGAAVLTVQLDPSVSKQLPPVFARPDESMRERRLAQILKAVALAYAACTVAAALMFVAAGHQGPELLIRTLSGPAAGGYGAAPENAAEAAAAGFVGLLSALGVWTIWRAAHGDLEPIWRDVEWRALFAATFGAAAIIMALDDGAGLWRAFYEAVAMITGAGGPFDADPIFSAPPAFAIGLAFVGGCTLSSAGGLKWSRIVRFIRELGR